MSYKFLPAENLSALKSSLVTIIDENNISSSKVSKAMGIDTATFKSLKDIDNEKVEITPDQYQRLVEFFRPKNIILNIGDEPDSYYDRFMFYLFKHGETVDNFVSKSGISKSSLKKIFTKNGVSGESTKIDSQQLLQKKNLIN